MCVLLVFKILQMVPNHAKSLIWTFAENLQKNIFSAPFNFAVSFQNGNIEL